METVPHTWNASITSLVDGKVYNFGKVSYLPLSSDLTKRYEHLDELERVVTECVNKELGEGAWRFTDKTDPYKFGAYPASDYGWSR